VRGQADTTGFIRVEFQFQPNQAIHLQIPPDLSACGASVLAHRSKLRLHADKADYFQIAVAGVRLQLRLHAAKGDGILSNTPFILACMKARTFSGEEVMTRTMCAAVFRGPGKLSLESRPVPEIKKDTDVLLEVEGASICGTDLHILADPPGHPATLGSIMGHEYVARVVDAGIAVSDLNVGDRVVVDPNITCGNCAYCKRGMANMCSQMTSLGIFIDGGFAEFNLAPARSLYRIDSETPIEQAIFAEPLSCVLNGFNQAQIQPGDHVVVLGAGPIGLLFIQLFRASGAGRVIAVEPAPLRRRFALASGADVVLDPGSDDCVARVMEHTEIGADIVVDAVGTLLPRAIELVRRRGRIILFGMNSHAQQTIAQNTITRHEISILGAYISRHTFPQVVKLLESQVLPLPKLVTHRVSLPEIDKAFAALRSGEAIEVIIKP